MTTKQTFLASSAAVILVLIVLGIIFLPKHAAAPSGGGVATTTASTTPYTIIVASTTTATVPVTTPTFDVNYWLQLGITRKEAGDYAGAIQAWGQVTANEPSSYIAFYDLGDLYQNFDVNYPLAEQNYLKVVALKPTYIDAYTSLYTLYQNQYKVGTSAADDILALGLKNNPGNAQLEALQTRSGQSNQ